MNNKIEKIDCCNPSLIPYSGYNFRTQIKVSPNNFNLEQSLTCGQIFLYSQVEKNIFFIQTRGRGVLASQLGENLYLTASLEETKEVWYNFFDLNRDYGHIKNEIIKIEPRLRPAIESNYGIHILKQDPFETIFGFITSQSKNINHIIDLHKVMSAKYGKEIIIGQDKYKLFPGIDDLVILDESSYRELKFGYRARYLDDAVKKIISGQIQLKSLYEMDYRSAKKELMKIKGVGEKVADCILLFAYGFEEAFPSDIWIVRAMNSLYNTSLKKPVEAMRKGQEIFANYAGYAQQYLFNYARMGENTIAGNAK